MRIWLERVADSDFQYGPRTILVLSHMILSARSFDALASYSGPIYVTVAYTLL